MTDRVRFRSRSTPLQHHYNTITTPSQHHCNTITTPLQHHHNTITTQSQHHCNTITTLSVHYRLIYCSLYKDAVSKFEGGGLFEYKIKCIGSGRGSLLYTVLPPH
jgi:hypothetical protein